MTPPTEECPPKSRIRQLALRGARAIGLFRLSRYIQRRRLRILCYHGISTDDSGEFQPWLFMDLETIRRRFSMLRAMHLNVVTLDAAVRGLASGTLPLDAVVITFDDGLFGNVDGMLRLSAEFQFPMTLYVATYYVDKGTPVFRLALRYLFWKAGGRDSEVSLTGVRHLPKALAVGVNLRAKRLLEDYLLKLTVHCERSLTEDQRVDVCRDIAERLGVDYQALADSRRLSLVNSEEIARLAAAGVDIQLHTHRHHMPESPDALRREILDNRRSLAAAGVTDCADLCYPSGAFDRSQFSILEELGVRSGTTCVPGLNGPNAHPLALRRFLDFESLTNLDFEAEICGFLDLVRRARRVFRDQPSITEAPPPVGYGH
jgi:peptidoglycan/xylan/chitin deacetylase (PgdA/CDA1 family)